MYIQDYILKRLKNTENFFKTIRLDKSTIYFKISLYKPIKKYPGLKNSALVDNYFKNCIKKINSVCKISRNEFRLED